MRNEDWLQKILYVIMAALAIYIIWKSGSLLLESEAVQKAMNEGTLQRPLEDAAVRTYMPGYTAAVEGRAEENLIAKWLKPVVPVYSYLAEQSMEESETNVTWDHNSEAENDSQLESGEQENIVNTDGEVEYRAEMRETDTEKSNTWNTVTEDAAFKSNITQEQNVYDDETMSEKVQLESDQPAVSRLISSSLRQQLNDFNYLISNYYTVDSGTTASEVLLDADTLLNTDLSLTQNSEIPQILIYHTHSQEAFADSQEGEVEDTVVGMGEVLAEHLRDYGYQVIHDTGVYDLVDGVLDRSAAYDYARAAVQQILEEHPTIEVIIDLHRDGVDGTKFVTEIGGKPVSKIMFFNGISRNSQDQQLTYLPNEYIRENLAFSLQLELLAREQYPDFTRNIYLKAERFNLHLRPRSLLIEAGTQLNTVEEERNAMELLANLLYQVLEGE